MYLGWIRIPSQEPLHWTPGRQKKAGSTKKDLEEDRQRRDEENEQVLVNTPETCLQWRDFVAALRVTGHTGS